MVYQIVITKRHLKIIPSTFGAIFRRKKFHKWPDGAYISLRVAPKLQQVWYALESHCLFALPYTRNYWRAFNLAIFAIEPPTKILAVLNLAIFSYA